MHTGPLRPFQWVEVDFVTADRLVIDFHFVWPFHCYWRHHNQERQSHNSVEEVPI